MPRYTVELDGRRIVLEGDHPPTEQDVRHLLAERPTVSPLERTQSRIAQRQSLVPMSRAASAGSVLSMFRPRETAKRNLEEFLMPLKGFARLGQEAALQLGAGQELAESVTASPFVSTQAKRPVGRDLLSVLKGERVVERGDIARNIGAPEPLAAMFGLATSPEFVIPGAVGAVKGAKAVGRLFKRQPTMSLEQLEGLSESAVSKLPSLERTAFFTRQQAKAQETAQRATADFTRLTVKNQQFLSARTAQAQQKLPATAARDLKRLNQLYPQVREIKNQEYRQLIQSAIEKNPSVRFSKEQIYESVSDELLESDSVLYRAILDELDNSKPLQKMFDIGANPGPLDILEASDNAAKKISRAVHEKIRAPYPEEFVADRFKSILHRLLEKNQIDVRPAKQQWAQWASIRNLALKLQTPQGPSRLTAILRGKDPIGAQRFEQLEALAGERLDRQTRELFSQLNYLGQKQALDKIKVLEKQRLLQQTKGLASDSLAAQRLRIEQQARHRTNVKRAIAAIIGGGVLLTVGRKVAGRVVNQLFRIGQE